MTKPELVRNPEFFATREKIAIPPMCRFKHFLYPRITDLQYYTGIGECETEIPEDFSPVLCSCEKFILVTQQGRP